MRAGLAILLILLATGTAASAQSNCRMALALGLDVSSSVDAAEYDLQRIGLAAALDAPQVRQAILDGPGYVALAVYEWSGHHQQKLHLTWSPLRSHADIDRAAATLFGMTRSQETFPTAVGQALIFGHSLLTQVPHCTRRVLDISGDGLHNSGITPDTAYDTLPFRDITVNGLAISGHDPNVYLFYLTQVIRGQNAFVITADGFSDFEDAMTRKLMRELGTVVVGRAQALPSYSTQ